MTSETRMGALAAVFGVAAALGLGWLRGPAAGVGLAVGAGLSLFNFWGLKAGVNAVARAAAAGRITPGMGWPMLWFFTRLGLLAAAVYAIFISHLLPISAVVAGLFAVPAAALTEALLQLAAPVARRS